MLMQSRLEKFTPKTFLEMYIFAALTVSSYKECSCT